MASSSSRFMFLVSSCPRFMFLSINFVLSFLFLLTSSGGVLAFTFSSSQENSNPPFLDIPTRFHSSHGIPASPSPRPAGASSINIHPFSSPPAPSIIIRQGKYIAFFEGNQKEGNQKEGNHINVDNEQQGGENPILSDWPMADYLTIRVDERVASQLQDQAERELVENKRLEIIAGIRVRNV